MVTDREKLKHQKRNSVYAYVQTSQLFSPKECTRWNVHHKIIETLRFLCLNERKISLVAICAVIKSCKDFATKRHLAPALMHFGTKFWSKMVVRWRYADLSMELSRNVCVKNASFTYTTWLLMTWWLLLHWKNDIAALWSCSSKPSASLLGKHVVASLLSLCMAKWLRKWRRGWLYVRSNTKNAKSLIVYFRSVSGAVCYSLSVFPSNIMFPFNKQGKLMFYHLVSWYMCSTWRCSHQISSEWPTPSVHPAQSRWIPWLIRKAGYSQTFNHRQWNWRRKLHYHTSNTQTLEGNRCDWPIVATSTEMWKVVWIQRHYWHWITRQILTHYQYKIGAMYQHTKYGKKKGWSS